MPAAARADRKNLGGALGCSTSVNVVAIASQRKDEDSSSPLRHSEELSVENPVRHAVPELSQATEKRGEISASMTGEKARNVLEDDGSRSLALHKPKEGEGESGSRLGSVDDAHPSPLSGDAEVL